MITLVIIKNPFEPHFKAVEQKEYCPLITVKGYYPEQPGLVYIINGLILDNPAATVPVDGTQIVVTTRVTGGDFGRILGFVATIALMAYAGAVAGGLWASSGAFAAGHWGAILAAGAISIIGGKIINSVFPQTISTNNDVSSSQLDSPSYGWDIPTPSQAEGNIMGVTYGECIPKAQVLTQHVETVDGKQYLNLLLCGGEGPIDEIKDIRIGNNAIGNYTGVNIETRLGTNNQEPISFFNNNPIDQYVSLELSENGLIQTTSSSKAQSLEVTMVWPGGLYRLDDNGGYGSTTVKIKLQYRPVGTTTWLTWTNDWEITGSQSNQLEQSLRLNGLQAEQYEVRAELLYRDKAARASTITRWELLTTYDPGKYSRPGKVLIGLRILATNQLSGGIPAVNWRQIRNTIYAWDPTARTYVAKNANNPIWAAYDILHQCRKLYNINTGLDEFVVEGVAASRLSAYWDEWLAAAAYADGQVKNNYGNYEKRFLFDAFYDTAQKRITAAERAAAVGHATILRRGNDIGVVADRPGSIGQIFGEGRTTASSVQGYFTSKSDRAREVEVTYNDTENDFKNTQFLVRKANWHDDDSEDNPASLTLFGVKRRSQAWREGFYSINTNERQLQYISFDCDVDAMRAEFGDIIGWNHQVNQIGMASGRIVSADVDKIRIDKDVELIAGNTYQIYIQRYDDKVITKLITCKVDTTTDVLALDEAMSEADIPHQFDNYAFGLIDKAVKPFKVCSIGISQEQLCNIKCCEYDPAVYADSEIDYSMYPVKDYTSPSQLQPPAGLNLTEINYVKSDKTAVSMIRAAWKLSRGSRADRFEVVYSTDGQTWSIWESTANMTSDITEVNPPRTYFVRVRSILDGVYSEPAQSTIIMTGYDAPPPDVTALHHELLANGRRRFWWNFIYPSPNDIAGFRFRYLPGAATNWDDAIPLHAGVITSQPFETDVLRQGTACVMIKAVDNRGQVSENAAAMMIDLGDVLQENVLYTVDLSANNWSALTHNGVVINGALHGQEISALWLSPSTAFWTAPTDAIWDAKFQAFEADYQFTAPASGQMWFDLKTSGSITVEYAIGTEELYYYPYTEKVRVKAGDVINIKIGGPAGAKNIIYSAILYIDVPDLSAHFEDKIIPVDGFEVPIPYSNAYTVGIRLDAVADGAILYIDYISKQNPCKFRLKDSAGNYVAKQVDFTWQGFIKEVVT